METLSDIVAQMRGRGEDGRMDRHLWNEYADRIEAAAKRVVVSKTETTTVGNAAAIREALEAAHEFVYTACRQNIDVMVKDKHGERVVKSKDVLYKIYSALSAPARNCDKFVTQPEMSRAYEEYRKSAMKNYRNGLTGRVPTVKQKPMTYDEWLLAPAAEEGAGK